LQAVTCTAIKFAHIKCPIMLRQWFQSEALRHDSNDSTEMLCKDI